MDMTVGYPWDIPCWSICPSTWISDGHPYGYLWIHFQFINKKYRKNLIFIQIKVFRYILSIIFEISKKKLKKKKIWSNWGLIPVIPAWQLRTLIIRPHNVDSTRIYINTLLRADLMRRKRMCQYVDASECDGFHKLYCVYRVWIRVKY